VRWIPSLTLVVALAACSSQEKEPAPALLPCDDCEWLVEGESVWPGALSSDGDALYVLKQPTNELYRYPHAETEAELLAADFPLVDILVAGESVLWAKVADDAVVLIDKASGEQVASSAVPGLWWMARGAEGLVMAVAEGRTKRITTLDELGQEGEALWTADSEASFRHFVADEGGVAWTLSTTLTDELYWLPSGVSEPEWLDLRALEVSVSSLAIHQGSLYLTGAEAKHALYRLDGGELVELAALSEFSWLLPAGQGLLTFSGTQRLNAFDADGEPLGSVDFPFLPTTLPAADDQWVFAGGEAELVRIPLSTFGL